MGIIRKTAPQTLTCTENPRKPKFNYLNEKVDNSVFIIWIWLPPKKPDRSQCVEIVMTLRCLLDVPGRERTRIEVRSDKGNAGGEAGAKFLDGDGHYSASVLITMWLKMIIF